VKKLPLLVLVLLVLLAIPQFVRSEFLLTVFVFTFILGIAAVSFNLIFGFTGQLSMFHAAAFGLGAYVTHISMVRLSVSFWTGLLCAIAFVLVLSIIIGAICFRYRLKEFYFAVVTLAFAEIARLGVHNWTSVTNGSLGIALTEKPAVTLPVVGTMVISGSHAWYYLALAALLVTLAVCSRILSSWIGRCFGAIRLNDELASTLGINVFRYKLLAFAVGNVFAALGGVLYAYYIGYIEAEYLSIPQSLAIISMVLLGGTGSLVGPVVGALVLTALPHVIQLSAEARVMTYGVILILVILLLPKGIFGTISGWVRPRRRGPAQPAGAPEPAVGRAAEAG
jgi:branched-chain amino acid transport system permease protein